MKRIVSLVLALSMVLSMFTAAFAGSTLTDVEGTNFESAVSALVELGIVNGYEDGSYRPNQVVSRAEMAKLLVIASGLEDAADLSKGTTNFSDVAADHWATGYINVAAEYGYINGYPDGTFAPDAAVKYSEAVTMAIRVLGYTSVVESKGTWPTNYIQQARELKVLDDVVYNSYGDGATRGNVALVIWNTLRTPMWDITGENESNGLNYGNGAGTNMIDKYFEDYLYIEEDEELVVTGITLSDNEVSITLDNDEDSKAAVTYEVANGVSFRNLYGRTVSALYNKDTEELVMVTPSTSDKVVEGYYGELEDDDYDFDSAEEIYFGTSAKTDVDFVSAVIDTRKEVAYMTRYQTSEDNYIVDEVEEAKNAVDVTDIYNTVISIDEDAIVLLGDEMISADDIKAGDVVTVLRMSSDGKYVTFCAVSRETVEGSFDSVTDETELDGQSYYITVDGDTYEYIIDTTAYEVDEDGDDAEKTDLDEILNDDESKFYDEDCTLFLNFLGEVVRIEFEEIKDVEDEGEFYVLTNEPATWTDSGKSGVVRYIELNGESYEVKTSSEDLDGFDYDALVAGSVVSVNFDSKDRVVDIRTIDPDNVDEYTFETFADEEIDDKNYIGNIKVGSSTIVYTITPVEDEDDDIIGYEVEITKGPKALNGVEEGTIAIDVEKDGRAAYVFVNEEAKNTENEFGIFTKYTVSNGKVYLTINNTKYELDEDDDSNITSGDVNSVVAFVENDDVITVSTIYRIGAISADDLVTMVDDELFETANITDGDLDVFAEDYDDYAVVLVKAKKNVEKGIYEFNSCKEISLSDIKLDEDEDIIFILEEDVDGVAAIVVIEGYKFATTSTGSGDNGSEDAPVVTTTEFTVTFDLNVSGDDLASVLVPSGDSTTPATSETLTAKGTVSGDVTTPAVAPEVSRTGFDFDGWFAAADCSGDALAATDFNAERTVYAKWTAQPAPAEEQ